MKLVQRISDRPGQGQRYAAWLRGLARVPAERERALRTAEVVERVELARMPLFAPIAGEIPEGALYEPKISRNAVGPKAQASAIHTTVPPDDRQKTDMLNLTGNDDAD